MAPITFKAAYHHYPDIDSTSGPGPLLGLLGLDDHFLSDREKQVLLILEKDEQKAGSDNRYRDFKWKIACFLAVQDIFDAPLLAGSEGIGETADSLSRLLYLARMM